MLSSSSLLAVVVLLAACVGKASAFFCDTFGLFCTLDDCVDGQPREFFLCNWFGIFCPPDCDFDNCSASITKEYFRTGENLDFEFRGYPDARGDVTLSTAVRGDFNGNDPDEFAFIRGEEDTLIGRTSATGNPIGSGCTEVAGIDTFTIDKDDFNDWNSNGRVDFEVDIQDGVMPPCPFQDVRLTITYDAARGC